MIDVAVSAVTVPATVPKSTAVAPARPVPVMVTAVPPAVVPLIGLSAVIVGTLPERRTCTSHRCSSHRPS